MKGQGRDCREQASLQEQLGSSAPSWPAAVGTGSRHSPLDPGYCIAPLDVHRSTGLATRRQPAADGRRQQRCCSQKSIQVHPFLNLCSCMYILRQPQVSTRCCWPLRMVGRGHKNRRRDKEPRNFHCKRSQQHPKLTVSYRARSHCCNAESRLEISKVHSPEDQNRTFGERMPGSLHRFHCLTHDSPLSGCSGAAGSAPSNSHLVFFLRGWTRHNCQANRSRRNGPSMEHPEVHVNTSEKHLQLKSTSRV
jgi:hypothetical protein